MDDELRRAMEHVKRTTPLPRCEHGAALRDNAGEVLEPPCGCRASELTVEQALKELREIFPDGAVIEFTIDSERPCASVIGYGQTTANTRCQILYRYGNTLAEVMAQVRAWKQSQYS